MRSYGTAVNGRGFLLGSPSERRGLGERNEHWWQYAEHKRSVGVDPTV